MTELAIGVLGGVITAVITFLLATATTLFWKVRKLGHLESLIPKDRRVQIVLPSAGVRDFDIKEEGTTAIFPPNVLIMPMREGMAVAMLANALNSLRRNVTLVLTTDDAVSNDCGLTFAVGGPSVNAESRRILHNFSDFKIKYPDHIAEAHGRIFEPRREPDDSLLEDWGFIVTRKSEETTRIVLCGVWGTGTEASVRGLLKIREKSQRKALNRDGTVITYKSAIAGLRASDPRITAMTTGGQTVLWN